MQPAVPFAASTTTTDHRRIVVRNNDLSSDEIRRAHEARRLHENIGHPSDGVLSTALDNGNLRDCNLTSQDVRNMRALIGPCAACYEGKATMPRGVPGLPPTTAPGELLHIDLLEYPVLTLGGYKWALIAVDDYTGFMSVIGMRNKNTTSIRDALQTLVTFYNQFRLRVNVFMMDAEHTLAAQGPYLAQWGIRIAPQIAGLHEKEVERSIRTLKDRERTVTAALTYELPAVLSGERRCYAAERINSMPNRSTTARTPAEIVTGAKPIVPNYPFGQIGLFYHTTVSAGDMQSRTDMGIIVGFNRDARNKYRVYFPLRGSVLARGSFQPLAEPPAEWGYARRIRAAALPPATPVDAATPTVSTVHAPAALDPPSDVQRHAGEVNTHIQSGTPIAPPLAAVAPATAPATVPAHAADEEGRNLSQQPPITNVQPLLGPIQPLPPPSNAQLRPSVQNTQPQPPVQPVSVPMPPPPSNSAQEAPTTLVQPVELQPKANTDREHHQHHVQEPAAPTAENITSAKKRRPRRTPAAEAPNTPVVTRSGREVRVNPRYMHASMINVAEQCHLYAYRTTVAQSMREYPNHTIEAIKNEIDYMIKYRVMIPEMYDESIREDLRRSAVPAHMFLKSKFLPNGSFDKLKARLVAGGNWQTEGTYGDTASPTVNPITVNTLINIMTVYDLECEAIDISGAFLSTPVLPSDKQQYVKLVPEVAQLWIRLYPEHRNYLHRDGYIYMRLEKYIYGLKQASNKFLHYLRDYLIANGFTQSIADECMYTMPTGNYLTVVTTHVDDLLVIAPSKADLQRFHLLLEAKWDISVQSGDELSYIGITIRRDRNNKRTAVSQQKYLEDIVAKYADLLGRDRSTPMELAFPNHQEVSEKCNVHDYLSIVMTLMYLARYTRPDILFATTYLATKCESPTQADMDAALKVVTYLRTTGVLAFVYSGSELSVQVYADASHGVHLDGRGHSCIIITLGSAPIATRSVKQKLVALHSTDAEVIAVTEAATYVLWLRVLLAELQFTLESPIPVHQDNTSAILIYNGSGKFKRSKHMMVKQQYIKDLIDRNIIHFKYLNTNDMLADIGTKPINGRQLQHFITNLGMEQVAR
jgi:hypothetical protein